MNAGLCESHRQRLWQDSEFAVGLWRFLQCLSASLAALSCDQQRCYWQACLEVTDALLTHQKPECMEAYQLTFEGIVRAPMQVCDAMMECRLHQLAAVMSEHAFISSAHRIRFKYYASVIELWWCGVTPNLAAASSTTH